MQILFTSVLTLVNSLILQWTKLESGQNVCSTLTPILQQKCRKRCDDSKLSGSHCYLLFNSCTWQSSSLTDGKVHLEMTVLQKKSWHCRPPPPPIIVVPAHSVQLVPFGITSGCSMRLLLRLQSNFHLCSISVRFLKFWPSLSFLCLPNRLLKKDFTLP